MYEKRTIKGIERAINENFIKKYTTNESLYNGYIIDNILFNEKTHLVAAFKDYLIIDDEYEFLKRFYMSDESTKRLIKYTAYYQKYSFLFPNYTALPESDYLYQNINKKQRIIDEQQKEKKSKKIKDEGKKNNNNINNNSTKDFNTDVNDNKSNKIFDSKVYGSILKSANNSCFSQFGIEKNNEIIDSAVDINRIVTEIDNVNLDKKKIIKLSDSPARPMHIYNKNLLNEVKTEEKNNKDKKFNKNIYNTNYCYNKFKNRNLNNLLYNNNINKKINPCTNTPLSKNKNIIFSPIYTKINIKSNKEKNANKNNNNLNKKNNNLNNKIINDNNQNKNRHSFVYRKLSPINKLSFSIKKSINNKESLKTITYYPLTTKSSIYCNSSQKKNRFMEVLTYDNKPNLINYTIKPNFINNNMTNQNLYLENTPVIKNKFLYAKRRANSEINCNYKSVNFIPKENIVYISNDFCSHKENQNLLKMKNKLKISQNNLNKKKVSKNSNKNKIYKTKSSSNNKKNSINNIVKPYITDSLIDSISNKIKKESQNHISKRIYNLINNNLNNNINKNNGNKKKFLKTSKKNTISLKKQFQFNKNKKQNNKTIKNKLISSLEKCNIYNKDNNKDTLGSFTTNTNLSNNMVHKNKVPISNIKKNFNNFSSPNSIKKNISFKQYINNNYSTINNTYNCQLFSHLIDVKKANNTIYSGEKNKNNDKYVYTCNMNNNTINNNKKLNTISGFRNKKLVINKENKKKILIVKKKEINTKPKNYMNKNIININNNKNISQHNKKNVEINNRFRIKEFEKIKIIDPSQALFTTDNFLTKNKTVKHKINKNIIFNNIQ